MFLRVFISLYTEYLEKPYYVKKLYNFV